MERNRPELGPAGTTRHPFFAQNPYWNQYENLSDGPEMTAIGGNAGFSVIKITDWLTADDKGIPLNFRCILMSFAVLNEHFSGSYTRA